MTYKFADVNFDILFRYKKVASILKDYETDGAPDTSVRVDDDAFDRMYKTFGNGVGWMSEFLALSRVVSDALLKDFNGFMFHSSAISFNGSGILFSALSGTGKSTHARFWKTVYGEKVTYVNDDKPFIRETDGEFFVYGNPWNGKERLSNNIRVPVKVICFIERGQKIEIGDVSVLKAVVNFFNQSFLVQEEDMRDKFLSLIERLFNSVKIVRVTLPLDENSPKVVYEAIKEYL